MRFTKDSNVEAVIKENQHRLDVIYSPYDPLVGTSYCEEIPRNRIEIRDAPIPVMYIPVEMETTKVVQVLRKTGTLKKAGSAVFGGAASTRKSLRVWSKFVKERCKYDFEFFCVHQIKIVHKELKQLVPFVLNRAQRHYLRTLELLRKTGQPIDIILLKARQWGGSTLTQFYMFWLQRCWRMHWNSVVCADIDNQSKKVIGMMERAANNYDTFIDDGKRINLHPYMKTDSTREMEDRGCTISVGSMQHPDAIRCEDLCMAHLTEVGLWKRTLLRKPEDVIQSIFGSILSGPYTLKVLESTAKGIGNFFHDTWIDACEGRNNFHPVFIPWFMIDIYSKVIEDYGQFIAEMTEYEWYLFDLGATLEAIAWYRVEEKGYREHWRFCSEYPSTADEAFQSTGSCYFDRFDLANMLTDCCDPKFVGDLHGRTYEGADSMKDLQFQEDEHGCFKVWEKPDTSVKMSNRYLVVVDLGKGRTQKADNSVITVFDRYWQTEPTGIPEVVADWVGHLPMDLVAWKAAQIATWYGNALLVIEDNSLVMSGIDYFMGVLKTLKDYYPNLYRRTIANKTESTGKDRWGWRTDGDTKPRICMNLAAAIRNGGSYIERNKDAIYGMQTFEEKPDGKLEAVEGKHDDRVITRAIGVTFLFDHKLMGAPMFLDDVAGDDKLKTLQRKVDNEYSI